jgi:hypothetical protein
MAVTEEGAGKVREAVGVFNEGQTFQEAIDDLLNSGFDYSELSLLAGEHAIKEKLGHEIERVKDAEDDPSVPRAAYIETESVGDGEGALIGGLFYVGAVAAAGAVVATGGAVAMAFAAAAAAGVGGGVIGSVLARWLDRHHAHYLQEQLDHGGLLLWVRTQTPEDEKRATEILKRHSGDDVHVHDLPEVEYDFKGGVSYDMSFMKLLGL